MRRVTFQSDVHNSWYWPTHLTAHDSESKCCRSPLTERSRHSLSFFFAVNISTFFFLCSNNQYLMQNSYLTLKTQWSAQVMSTVFIKSHLINSTVFIKSRLINSSPHVIYVLREMGVNFIIRETRKAEYLATGEACKAIFWPQKWTTDKSLD